MRAIILAAGRGSRMKSLTDERPKCLVQLHGKALIDHQLEALRGAGISEIAIVTGYKREMLSNRGLIEFHNARWETTNMVSSLACASSWLEKEPCIVSYSDIFYGPAAVESLINCNAAIAIAYDPNWLLLWTNRFGDPLLDAETFRLNSKKFLSEIGGKPKSIDEIQGQYMGLLRFTPESWSGVVQVRSELAQELQDKMHMTGTLQMLIETGHKEIEALPYTGEWGEIDSQQDLASYFQKSEKKITG